MIYSSLYRLIITTAARQTGEDNYVMVCNGLHNYHIDSGHLELDFTHKITIPSTSEELSFQRSKLTETKAGFCFSSVSCGHRTCCILASLMSTSEPMTLSLQAYKEADQKVSTRYLNAIA